MRSAEPRGTESPREHGEIQGASERGAVLVAAAHTGEPPTVIVGTGPVGMRTAQELLQRGPQRPIVIYGNEPWLPYNRVRLSALMSGELSWASAFNPLNLPPNARVTERYNCAVVAIDRAARTVTDETGVVQPYAHLVLATGSRAHIPSIEGTALPGVFTFRDMTDVEKLLARRVRTRRTVVLGGGLLGLEAARAMQRFNTEVYIIEHGSHLMQRQLDEAAGEILRERVLRLGIRVITRDSVRAIAGTDAVERLILRSGRELECDTVILATGIVPNIQLALEAGIAVGRGVRVDDHMQTNDPHVFAVGECCEHRGQVYGLVGPGYEQAAVAAHRIAGGEASYQGSLVAARLKVVGESVFSMGRVGPEERVSELKSITHRGHAVGFRKVVLHRGRLAGAIALGPWAQLGRLQESIIARRRVWPWQVARFRRHGELWPAQEDESVARWPAHAVVCNCTGVTRGALTQAMEGGCNTVAGLMSCTGASTVCGSCRPMLAELVGGGVVGQGLAPTHRAMLVVTVVALLVALLTALAPGIAPSPSISAAIRPDVLWTDGLLKQISGYALLTLSLLGLLLSLRKRWKRLSFGDVSKWQLAHVVVGAAIALVLVAHTGMHLGENLNRWLMLDFLALLLLGGATGAFVALQRRLSARSGQRWRERWLWAHTALFWPFPVLVGFHILSVYYF